MTICEDCVVENEGSCLSMGCATAKAKLDENKKCSLRCPDEKTNHKVADGNSDRSYECGVSGKEEAARYCCCT